MNNLGAIILAAGKGTRMKSSRVNKVTLPLAETPMVLHTYRILKNLSIMTIVVVVGFAKTSVVPLFKGKKVIFANQTKRLGTGHAVLVALKKMPRGMQDILVLNGDDSALYKTETIKDLIKKHIQTDAAFTFLTLEMEKPNGLGRVVRDKEGNVLAIIEEKDASPDVTKIREINPACYLFKRSFLDKYLKKIKKSPISGEYYLTSLIDMGIKNNEKIETLQAGLFAWRGVNTKEELEEAEAIFKTINKVI